MALRPTTQHTYMASVSNDPRITSKYSGTVHVPAVAGTRPPIVYGRPAPDSEFHFIATPCIQGGVPVPDTVEKMKATAAPAASIWRKDSSLVHTKRFGAA